MSTAMTVVFDTQYGPEGTQQFKAGMNEVQSSVEKVEGSSDRLVTKLERPIGRIAYGGIAESALNAASANEKLDGVTGTLEQSFHVLGSTLLFVQPELGFLALGAAALVTLFVKLKNANEENADNVGKNVETYRKQREEYSKSADDLKKLNLINEDEYKTLKNLSTASEEQIQKVRDEVREKVALRKASLDIQEERLKEANFINREARQQEVAKAQKLYNDAVAAESGLLSDARDKIDEETKALEKHYKALNDELELRVKIIARQKEAKEFQGVDKATLEDMISSEDEIEKLTEKLNDAKTDSDKAELQAHIDYLMKRVAADRTILTEEKAIQKQRESGIVELGKVLVAESGRFMHDLVEGNLVALKQDVANFAWAQSEKLFAQAVADSFDPIRAFLAPEEFAASAGLAALGAGLGTSNASNNSTSGAGALASPSSPSTSGQGNQATLTFNINGGVIDHPTIAYMIGEINKLVQQNGFPLVATQINSGTPIPGS